MKYYFYNIYYVSTIVVLFILTIFLIIFNKEIL